MKKYVNGEYLDMTPEEEAEMKKQAEKVIEPMPSMLERLEAIEAVLLEGVLLGE